MSDRNLVDFLLIRGTSSPGPPYTRPLAGAPKPRSARVARSLRSLAIYSQALRSSHDQPVQREQRRRGTAG